MTEQEMTGKEHPGKEQQGKENQENYSTMWLTASGFTVMKLAFRLSLAYHLACAHIWSDSGSFLVVQAFIPQ